MPTPPTPRRSAPPLPGRTRGPLRAAARGAAASLGIVALFVAGGLAAAVALTARTERLATPAAPAGRDAPRVAAAPASYTHAP